MTPELEPNIERFVSAPVELGHQGTELVSQPGNFRLELLRVLI
jgi:hypothetical protein